MTEELQIVVVKENRSWWDLPWTAWVAPETKEDFPFRCLSCAMTRGGAIRDVRWKWDQRLKEEEKRAGRIEISREEIPLRSETAP